MIVDCASSLSTTRLQAAIKTLDEDVQTRFHHYNTPTLAHIIALVHHTTPSFPPDNTALLVIDDVTLLFPPPSKATTMNTQSKSKPNGPTYALAQSTLLTALGKIAASHNVAVLINSYVSTRMRSAGGALLVATHGSKDWDQNLSSRLVFFRDFPPRHVSQQHGKSKERDEALRHLRFAGIVKAHGMSGVENDMLRNLVPFILSAVCSLPA